LGEGGEGLVDPVGFDQLGDDLDGQFAAGLQAVADGGIERGDGFVAAVEGPEQPAEVAPGVGVLRVELDGLLEGR
jgi:hypothetical protein